jgi:hypothetical protein
MSPAFKVREQVQKPANEVGLSRRDCETIGKVETECEALTGAVRDSVGTEIRKLNTMIEVIAKSVRNETGIRFAIPQYRRHPGRDSSIFTQMADR